MQSKLFLSGSLFLACVNLHAEPQQTSKEERPNILWLTFEDTSAAEFGCYGNKDVNTPIIDSLAARGIQYMNAWSVAPQSSPARSSLFTGMYATNYGMDVHHYKQLTPENIFFPQLLRDAGYYCTNNHKTHYNTAINHLACWGESDKKASYNSPKRKTNQPFFAVFNTVTSHMGRVRTFHTEGRRDYSKEGIDVETLTLPDYVPDLAEIRSDYAGHLEAVQDVDEWVGYFLQDLKAKGLDDNTIVFVFSDHGGCLPRGKGYLFETGLRVPFVVYLPEKWKHLAPQNTIGKQNSSLINFVDLAPTLLSIIGEAIPKDLQGKAFLGKHSEQKAYNFAFAANQLHHFMPVRAVSDGKFKYMRSYMPYRQFTLRNYYQWGMPSNLAWDSLWLSGKIEQTVYQLPYEHHSYEMLFDLEHDPYELHNLSQNPQHKKVLEELRLAVDKHIDSTSDLGFFIPSYRKDINLYDRVHQTNYPLQALQQLAAKAGNPDIQALDYFLKNLQNEDVNFRFWAAVAFANLALTGQYADCPAELQFLLEDDNAHVAAEAALACAYLGETQMAVQALIHQKINKRAKIAYSALECLSHEKAFHKEIKKYSHILEKDAYELPYVENEDPGLMARGILANIGLWSVKDIYKEQYELGLKLNKGRRPKLPMP